MAIIRLSQRRVGIAFPTRKSHVLVVTLGMQHVENLATISNFAVAISALIGLQDQAHSLLVRRQRELFARIVSA